MPKKALGTVRSAHEELPAQLNDCVSASSPYLLLGRRDVGIVDDNAISALGDAVAGKIGGLPAQPLLLCHAIERVLFLSRGQPQLCKGQPVALHAPVLLFVGTRWLGGRSHKGGSLGPAIARGTSQFHPGSPRRGCSGGVNCPNIQEIFLVRQRPLQLLCFLRSGALALLSRE